MYENAFKLAFLRLADIEEGVEIMAIPFLESLGERCPKCHGDGVLPRGHADEDILTCPTCKGDGVVLTEITKVDHVEQVCDNPLCHQGKVTQSVTQADGRPQDHEVDCPVCDGLTRIMREVTRTYEEAQTCPTCKGAGQISMKTLREKGEQVLCDMCKGLGILPHKKKVGFLALGAGFIILMPMVAFVVILLGFMGFALVRTFKRKSSEKPAKIKRSRREKA